MGKPATEAGEAPNLRNSASELPPWSLDSAVSMSATRPHRLSLFSVAFTNPRGRCGNGRPRKDEYSPKKLGASLNHLVCEGEGLLAL